MDKSKTYQLNQKYNLGNGTLNLNIYNGRLLYEYPLCEIGSGSYAISSTLMYNTFYKATDFGRKKLGFGNGWKYNFEQYLFPYIMTYDIEGFEESDYVYIDSNWCIHRFVRYKNKISEGVESSSYYDASGTGLKLEIVDNIKPKIFDEFSNVYVFENEKLVSVTSGVNSEIKKIIEYDTNNKERINSIYDSRKPERKIKFEYDELGQPINVLSTTNYLSYKITYDNKKLLNICKKSMSKEKEVHQFIYGTNNKIEYIINSEDLKALKLKYIDRDNEIKISKVTTGAMKKEIITEENQAEIYLGENDYLNEIKWLTSTDKKKAKEILIMPEDYILEELTYNYNKSYTEIINYKNIAMRYYFDTLGKTIGNLEYDTGESAPKKYYTTTRPSGWSIKIDGKANVLVNGISSKIIQMNENKYVLNIEDSAFDTFKREIVTLTKESLENFTLSFWLNFEKRNDTITIATLKYKLNGSERSTKTLINKTLGDAWQLVKLHLNLEEPEKNLSEVSIILSNDSNIEESDNKIYISDVRINKGNNRTICIENAKANSKEYEELAIGKKIYYQDANQETIEEKEITINSQFYITEKDIIATYRSLYDNLEKNITSYELYYCNKTKVKAVRYVGLVSNTEENYRYYRFTFNEYDENDNIKNIGIPNYFFRMVDLVNISDEETQDNRIYIITEIQKRIHKRDSNRYYYETKTATAPSKKADINKRIKDKDSVLNYVWENDDGTTRAVKYCKKEIKDNKEKDIKIKTEYLYDEFGNMTEQITLEEDNSESEVLSRKYIYDENDNLIETNIEGIKVTYEYNNNGNLVKENNENNKIKYIYNEFDELKEIKFFDENKTEISKNIITQNKYGQINLVSDLNGDKYGFLYNAHSKPCEIYHNKKMIEKQYSERTKNEDKTVMQINQANDKVLINTKTYDKYGKIKEYEVGQFQNNEIIDKMTTIFEYEKTDKISPNHKRISKIIDPFSEAEYTYEYDDDKRIISEINTINNIKIDTTDTTKEYNYQSEGITLKQKIIKEDQINNNPKSSHYYIDNEIIPCCSYNFEYDNIGRLKSKKGIYGLISLFKRGQINQNIKYKKNTTIPKEIVYEIITSPINDDNDKEIKTITYHITYNQGKIIKVDELENNTEKSSEYQYDSMARLIKEITPDQDIIEYNYNNNSNMLSNITQNNETRKIFEYENNKLTKIIENDTINIKYDNYGNIIQIGNNKITYNKRNQLETYETQEQKKYIYSYNYNGIRYKKEQVAGKKVNYYLDGARIIGEDITNKDNEIEVKMRYTYDAEGISGIVYIANSTIRYYNLLKDPLRNISKIVYQGEIIGEYIYDTWGNFKIEETGILEEEDKYILYNNPFRYKGYYYDVETNLYYCNSRYYSPELCRFIQPADVSSLNPHSINGLNLYSYANNNPINISYSSSSIGGSVNSGMISALLLGDSIGGGSYLLGAMGLSVKFPSQNWGLLGTDFTASIVGAMSVVRWTIKNPEFYDFLYSAYGISNYEMLSNLKSPLTKVISVISYGLVAHDTYTDVMGHINAGDSWQTTTASGVVTAGLGVLNIWASTKTGAAIGGTIGGVHGFLIGTAAGFVVGVVINVVFYTEINGKSIAGYIEDGIEWFLEWIS